MRYHIICPTSFHRLILIPGVIFFFFFLNACEKETVNQDQVCLLKRCDITRNWDSGSQIDTLIWEFEYNNDGILSKYINHSIDDGYDYDEEYVFIYKDNGKIERIEEYDAGNLDHSFVFTWKDNTATMIQWWDTGDTLEPEDRIFEWEFNSKNELVRLNDYMDVTGDEVAELWEYWKFYYQNGSLIKIEDFGKDSIYRTISYTTDDNYNPFSFTKLGWFFDFDLFLSRNNILTEEIFNHHLNEVTTTKSVTYTYNEYGYPVEMISSQVSPSFTRDEIWKFEYVCDSI